MCSAAVFQLCTMPLRSLLTMPSSDDSMMARKRLSSSDVAGLFWFAWLSAVVIAIGQCGTYGSYDPSTNGGRWCRKSLGGSARCGNGGKTHGNGGGVAIETAGLTTSSYERMFVRIFRLVRVGGASACIAGII